MEPWNSRPGDVVVSKEINVFKNKLDKFVRDVKGLLKANALSLFVWPPVGSLLLISTVLTAIYLTVSHSIAQ